MQDFAYDIVYCKENQKKYNRSRIFRWIYVYFNSIIITAAVILDILINFFIKPNPVLVFTFIGLITYSLIFIISSIIFLSINYRNLIVWSWINKMPIIGRGTSMVNIYYSCAFILDKKNEWIQPLFREIFEIDILSIRRFWLPTYPMAKEILIDISNKHSIPYKDVLRVYKHITQIKDFWLSEEHYTIGEVEYNIKSKLKLMNVHLYWFMQCYYGIICLIIMRIILLILHK